MVGIKDLEMPSCCEKCQVSSCKGLSGQFYCDITTYDVDIDDTERDANCPFVEAISKDQYKADMVSTLEELKKEIEEMKMQSLTEKEIWNNAIGVCSGLIQQKINKLKGGEDETKDNNSEK